MVKLSTLGSDARVWGFLLAGILLSAPALADFADAKEALKKKSYDEAYVQFHKLAELGHGRSSFEIAELNAKGRGVEVNPVIAYAWYELAHDQGYKEARSKADKLHRGFDEVELESAQRKLNELDEKYGKGVIANKLLPATFNSRYQLSDMVSTRGLEWPREFKFRMQAATVFVEFDVAVDGSPRDFRLLRDSPAPFVREAIKHLRRRTVGSGPDSRPRFGQITRYTFYIRNRNEGSQNYGEAKLLRKLKKRAETGSPYRKYFYGYALELHQALHKEVNPAAFNKWYIAAAQAGHPKAQYIVGNRLLTGETMQQDTQKALRWLNLAVENDDPFAAYLLSQLVTGERKGRLLKQAADSGHTTAMLKHAQILVAEGRESDAETYLENAEAHLDKGTWFETAALIFANSDVERANEYRQRALEY